MTPLAPRPSSEDLPRGTPLLVPDALSPQQALPERTRDAGPSALAPMPAEQGSADAGALGGDTPTPSVRFDFEAGLDGWQIDRNQRPADTLDSVDQSTALAHHGSGALRMSFDGAYTPLQPFGFDPRPFYGVFEVGAPPPDVEVSLWMFTTAAGVSAEVYTQTGAAYTTTILATVPLVPNEWQQITLTTPLEPAQQFGIRVDSALDLRGVVYLDEISW